MLKRFVSISEPKATQVNDSITLMDYNIKLRKGGAINLKFKEDPVEKEENRGKVHPNTRDTDGLAFILRSARCLHPRAQYSSLGCGSTPSVLNPL